MINFLNNIRVPDKNIKVKDKIINTSLIFLLGILLGAFSKWLDNMVIDDTIWYQKILGILDLGNVLSELEIWLFIAITISVFSKTPLRAGLNVFLFFIGMTVSYHLYSIYFSGFNPMEYMMKWYSISLISPILAFVGWYSKGENFISIIISSLIICIMMNLCFSIGIWYFDFKSLIDFMAFVGTIAVLYVKPKNTLYSLIIAFPLAFIACNI